MTDFSHDRNAPRWRDAGIRALYLTMTTEQLKRLRAAFEADLADIHRSSDGRDRRAAVRFARERLAVLQDILRERDSGAP